MLLPPAGALVAAMLVNGCAAAGADDAAAVALALAAVAEGLLAVPAAAAAAGGLSLMKALQETHQRCPEAGSRISGTKQLAFGHESASLWVSEGVSEVHVIWIKTNAHTPSRASLAAMWGS